MTRSIIRDAQLLSYLSSTNWVLSKIPQVSHNCFGRSDQLVKHLEYVYKKPLSGVHSPRSCVCVRALCCGFMVCRFTYLQLHYCKWVVAAIILMNKHDIPRLQIFAVNHRVRAQFLSVSDLPYPICKKSNLS